ncbi:hypothetical protein KI387_031090, partial [Taxus chinensis]
KQHQLHPSHPLMTLTLSQLATFSKAMCSWCIKLLCKKIKENSSCEQILLMKKAELTVTLNVAHKFIPMHEDKVVAGKGIQITNFSIAPKTSYDHGDCDVILLLNESSTVESTPPLSIEYKFIPDTTVKQLLNSTEPYAIGTIAAIVTSTKQIGLQLILEIKDGANGRRHNK